MGVNPMVSFWVQWGGQIASLATVLAVIVTAASAVIAALALRRTRDIHFERNSFEFLMSFGKDELFLEGRKLLKELHDSGPLPAYYSLGEDQRIPITEVMNAYDMAGDLIARGFIDEAAFIASYSWFIQTHWKWTYPYITQIRQQSVGGPAAYASFDRLRRRAACLHPHIANALGNST